ncbi:FadR/GntR family transcriptional regulator [Pseudomonas putida]
MSTLPPIARLSLVDSAIEVLKHNITSGVWPLGQRLPREADLAEQLGIGRNSVREAVRTLAYAGILDVRQGDGTFVRRTVDPTDTMRRIDRAALRDHLELQCTLEAECARLAAQRRTDQDLVALKAALAHRGERDPRQDLEAFVARDHAFHVAIAVATHNQALEALYRYFSSTIQGTVATLLAEFESAEVPEPDLAAHQRVLDAIEQRDAPGAGQAALALLQSQVDWLQARSPGTP